MDVKSFGLKALNSIFTYGVEREKDTEYLRIKRYKIKNWNKIKECEEKQ